jgi:fibronectin type 3 domain-containing protein
VGDLNNDQLVDAVDIELVRTNFGSEGGAGDANSDGVVDLADYNLVKNNLGATFSYVVESSSDGINFSVAARLASNVTTYTHTGLTGSQSYFYRVRTSDSAGQSEPSERVMGTTKPAAVTNVRVISYSSSELVIDWTDTSGENSYRIERSLNGVDGWTVRGILSRNRPAFNDTGLAANRTYYYRILTIGLGSQVSAISQVASGTTKAISNNVSSSEAIASLSRWFVNRDNFSNEFRAQHKNAVSVQFEASVDFLHGRQPTLESSDGIRPGGVEKLPSVGYSLRAERGTVWPALPLALTETKAIDIALEILGNPTIASYRG